MLCFLVGRVNFTVRIFGVSSIGNTQLYVLCWIIDSSQEFMSSKRCPLQVVNDVGSLRKLLFDGSSSIVW